MVKNDSFDFQKKDINEKTPAYLCAWITFYSPFYFTLLSTALEKFWGGILGRMFDPNFQIFSRFLKNYFSKYGVLGSIDIIFVDSCSVNANTPIFFIQKVIALKTKFLNFFNRFFLNFFVFSQKLLSLNLKKWVEFN